MVFQKLREIISGVLVVLLAAPGLTADTVARGGGMLAARGTVTINGYEVGAPSAVLGGEKVVTGNNSMAHITSRGSLALLGPQSKATYLFKSIKLESGSVNVTTSNGTSVLAARLVISPAVRSAANSAYEVSESSGTVTISAEKGDVSLSNGATVLENTSLTLSLAQQNPQEPAGDQPSGQTSSGRGIQHQPPPSGATINHPPCTKRYHDHDVNICVLALIAAAGGIVAYELLKPGKSSSPSKTTTGTGTGTGK
jgi:hypothetical protein